MSECEDWELIARAQSGDTSAFAELVRRYQTPVVHFCRRMVGSTQDAEDLAQDSFIRVYRYLDRLEPRAKFSTVLFGVARNLTLNFLRDSRRRGRDMTHSLTTLDETQKAIADTRRGPSRHAQLGEIEDMLEQGLARLSPDHREIIVLREINGLEYDDIARVVKCRKGTVKSRLARAREQLRMHMKELGGDLL